MKSDKGKEKKPIKAHLSKGYFIPDEDDMIIQENENYKEVNMTSSLKKLLGFKSTKKKEKK